MIRVNDSVAADARVDDRASRGGVALAPHRVKLLNRQARRLVLAQVGPLLRLVEQALRR
jgi:hypothetical protein